MTYLLLICVAENVQLTPEQSAAVGPATDSWVAEMDGRGVRREGAPLRPVREAAVVRVRDDQVLVSDGPFAETKEQIARPRRSRWRPGIRPPGSARSRSGRSTQAAGGGRRFAASRATVPST